MIRQQRFLTLFIGIIGCLLLLSSCFLFRSPKAKEVTIQNPPPTDRNYLACRVNGTPVIFQTRRNWLRSYPPYFNVQEDSIGNKLTIDLVLRGGNKTAFESYIEIRIDKEFSIKKNLVDIDKSLFEKTKLKDAKLYRALPESDSYVLQKESFELDGEIQISAFEYSKDPNTGKVKGRMAGCFELRSKGFSSQYDQIEITDGVFNVIKYREDED